MLSQKSLRLLRFLTLPTHYADSMHTHARVHTHTFIHTSSYHLRLKGHAFLTTTKCHTLPQLGKGLLTGLLASQSTPSKPSSSQ